MQNPETIITVLYSILKKTFRIIYNLARLASVLDCGKYLHPSMAGETFLKILGWGRNVNQSQTHSLDMPKRKLCTTKGKSIKNTFPCNLSFGLLSECA